MVAAAVVVVTDVVMDAATDAVTKITSADAEDADKINKELAALFQVLHNMNAQPILHSSFACHYLQHQLIRFIHSLRTYLR